jgi:drug/metabolite transporter (DMT)-like permease
VLTYLTYFFAVLAACANATASVLQRKANREISRKENLSWKLIRDLLHEPVWFGGVLAVIAGFLLQAAALGSGQLSVVEPILILELPATLLLGSRVFGSRLGLREWGPAVTMTAGLAGLLYFLSPSQGHSTGVHWYVWVLGAGANVGLIAALVVVGRRGPAGRGRGSAGSSARQAAVFGVAAGAGFGLTAALMKGMTTAFSHGIVALFTSWQLYGMIAAGALAMFLLQSAMNAGRLIAAQPGLSLTDPIVSILWGILAFGENVRGGLFLLLAVLAGCLMAASVIALARSPMLAGASGSTEEGQRAGASGGGEEGQRAGEDQRAGAGEDQRDEDGPGDRVVSSGLGSAGTQDEGGGG